MKLTAPRRKLKCQRQRLQNAAKDNAPSVVRIPPTKAAPRDKKANPNEILLALANTAITAAAKRRYAVADVGFERRIDIKKTNRWK